jgi:DnaJ homolog subfamily C member 9
MYDDYGLIEGEDELFNSSAKDWELYFRNLFKKVTTEDMDDFFRTYQNSNEERHDLIRIYEETKGDMDEIMDRMFSADSMADEPRFEFFEFNSFFEFNYC